MSAFSPLFVLPSFFSQISHFLPLPPSCFLTLSLPPFSAFLGFDDVTVLFSIGAGGKKVKSKRAKVVLSSESDSEESSSDAESSSSEDERRR